MGNADKPLRVAFLGTGYIADWHAKAVSTIVMPANINVKVLALTLVP